MIMIIKRFCTHPEVGTFGKLFIDDKEYYTCEQPWQDNEPFVSCVPPGHYSLIPYTSERYGETFKLININNHVYENKAEDGDRFDIIFHAGNTMEDTMGCILVGKSLSMLNGLWAIGSSRKAFNELKEIWSKEQPLKVTIT